MFRHKLYSAHTMAAVKNNIDYQHGISARNFGFFLPDCIDTWKVHRMFLSTGCCYKYHSSVTPWVCEEQCIQ